MRALLQSLAPVALLAGLACQPQTAPAVYGPWEEGLTLAFEDPSQPQPQRSEDRLQLRVARGTLGPGAPGLIELDLTSTRSHLLVLARHREGGIDLVEPGGRVLAQALPPHFPDTPSWTDRGTQFHVVGRAAWVGAGLLPSTADPVGIWVESRSPQGLRRRTLYLPNLGEVEAREERDGAWITVNRLVARGFTDLPSSKRP